MPYHLATPQCRSVPVYRRSTSTTGRETQQRPRDLDEMPRARPLRHLEEPVDGRDRRRSRRPGTRRASRTSPGRREARSFAGRAARSVGADQLAERAEEAATAFLETSPTVAVRRSGGRPRRSTPCARRRAAQQTGSPSGGRAGASVVPSPVPSCGPVRRKSGTSAPSPAASACSSPSGSGSRAARSPAREPRPHPSCHRRARRQRGSASRCARASPGSTPAASASESSALGRWCPPEPLDDQRVGRPELDVVTEVDRLQDGRDLVPTVGTKRADDQCEIELRRRA